MDKITTNNFNSLFSIQMKLSYLLYWDVVAPWVYPELMEILVNVILRIKKIIEQDVQLY